MALAYANAATFEGFTIGDLSKGARLGWLPAETGVIGLSQPGRTTTLSDRQGHGRVPGSQWANERLIKATVYAPDLATVLAFDNAMAPRPDPNDQPEFVCNFLGVGDQKMYVRPERCDWAITREGVYANFWRIEAEWVAAEPTIFSAVPSDLSFGGDTPVTSVDLKVFNVGLAASLSPRAWWARIQAHGPVSDPFIRHLDAGHEGESIRFTGLNMTSGEVLLINTDRTCTIGSEHAEGRIRSGGSKFPSWPVLDGGGDPDDDGTANNIRIGAITGEISGNFHHDSTWSI